MAEKDAMERTLEDHNDVFSDILNVLVYHGKQEIEPEALENATARSVYRADGILRDQERDIAKYWKNIKFRVALFGVENQTEPEADMPLRIIGYDGASYRNQLFFKKDDQGRWRKNRNPRYPVITLVLYFGYRKHWDKAKTLKEALAKYPAELEPYVSDYRINVIEVAWLTEEQVELFQSDFKVVADFFVQMRKNGTYVPGRQQLVHVQEVLRTMAVLTQDDRFEEAYQRAEGEGAPRNMCEFLDVVENRGIEKGIEQGIEQGIERGIIIGYIALRREDGYEEAAIKQGIMERFGLSEEQAGQYMCGKTD